MVVNPNLLNGVTKTEMSIGLDLDWIRAMRNFVESGLDLNCKLLYKFRIRTGFGLS